MEYTEIIRSHKELMNSNYYDDNVVINNTERDGVVKSYSLPPFYFCKDDNVKYNSELFSIITTTYDTHKVYIVIKTNFLMIYGSFASLYSECYDEMSQSEYWHSKAMNNSTWENPYIVLCCLIENCINPQLVPKAIESLENNRHILITFTNNTSFYIDKLTLKIEDQIEQEEEHQLLNRIVEGIRQVDEYVGKDNSEEDIIEYKLTKELKSDLIKESIQKEKEKEKESQIEIDEDKEMINPEIQIQNDIKAFKDLLKEKEITPTTPYDRIEVLIKYDKRYKAISHDLRYSLFKDYQSSLQQSLNKSKHFVLQRQKQIKDYKLLLKSSIESGELDLATTLSSFLEANKHNPVITEVNEQDRDFLFNEVKLRLKKLFEENKARFKEAFISFVSSQCPIDKITPNTTIEHIKSALKSHKEYLIIPSKTERNQILTEYLDRMKSLIAIKTQGFLSLDLINNAHSDNIVVKLQLEYDIREFNKMLMEIIRYEMTYEEAMTKLEKDLRWWKINDEGQRKELFKAYMTTMITQHHNDYRQLLEEKIGLNEEITWHDAQHLLQRDLKYKNVQEKEREAIFNEYKADMLNRIMNQFEMLIEERSDIVNKDSPTEGIKYDALLNVLNSDIRAQRTMRHPDKRDKLLRMKIKSMKFKYEKELREKRKFQMRGDKGRNEEKIELMEKKWEKGHVIK